MLGIFPKLNHNSEQEPLRAQGSERVRDLPKIPQPERDRTRIQTCIPQSPSASHKGQAVLNQSAGKPRRDSCVGRIEGQMSFPCSQSLETRNHVLSLTLHLLPSWKLSRARFPPLLCSSQGSAGVIPGSAKAFRNSGTCGAQGHQHS